MRSPRCRSRCRWLSRLSREDLEYRVIWGYVGLYRVIYVVWWVRMLSLGVIGLGLGFRVRWRMLGLQVYSAKF